MVKKDVGPTILNFSSFSEKVGKKHDFIETSYILFYML